MVSGFWNIVSWTFKYLIKGTQQVIYWSIQFLVIKEGVWNYKLSSSQTWKERNLVPCSSLNYSTERVCETEWTYCIIIIFTNPFIIFFCNWICVKNHPKVIILGLAKFVHFLIHNFWDRRKWPIHSPVVSSIFDLFQALGREDFVQNSNSTALCTAMHKSIAKWEIMDTGTILLSTILSFSD